MWEANLQGEWPPSALAIDFVCRQCPGIDWIITVASAEQWPAIEFFPAYVMRGVPDKSGKILKVDPFDIALAKVSSQLRWSGK